MKSIFKTSLISTFVILALFGSAIGVTPAHAATLTVTKTADTNDGICNSDCSLREAIASVSPIDNAINFNPALAGKTIHLASTLALNEDVTIDGSPLVVPVAISGDSDNDGDGDVRVFFIGNAVTVVLSGLVITKGHVVSDVGGGLVNNGILTINNSVFYDNGATSDGGAIFNFEGLIINGSTFSGNKAGGSGGAISTTDSITLTNSTLTRNTAAGEGGGILVDSGTATINGSTLADNSADHGGGIRNHGGTTVANSTFSDNTTSGLGGGVYNSGTFTVSNSTFSGNISDDGAGIMNAGTLNYANTIIANSTGSDCFQIGGSIGTNTNNLIEDGSCSPAMTGDPSLDILADNGGPTQTFALLPGSPAIDTGDNATCAAAPVNNLDQRGAARPITTINAICDIGAYEADYLVVTTNADTDDGMCNSHCSLREAVNDANASPDLDAIRFDGSYSITLGSSLPSNTDDLTINGQGYDVIIDGADSYLIVETFDDLHLKNLTIQNGNSANGGALLLHNFLTTIVNVTFFSNTTSSSGGVIYGLGPVNVRDSTFIDNNAAGSAGAIRNEGSTLTVSNSTFKGNAASLGGAIFTTGSATTTILNSTFSGNSGPSSGGDIYHNGGTLNYANTIMANAVSGGNCINAATLGVNINNLVEDGSCSAALSGDPNLDPLANNGGSTQTFALPASSIAVDAGNDAACLGAGVNGIDQRSFLRPNGEHCDIGSYEYNHPPVVSSMVRAGANPTNDASVDFTVTFSEAVTGVDIGDFSMTTFDLTGASLTSQTGSGDTYTVTVNTGSGNGTLTLELLDNNSIQDNLGALLGGPGASDGYFMGETYFVDKTVPTVSTILRFNTSPTNAASVDFEVTFSEPVFGVDTADFSLTTTGVSGASVTGASGSGMTRTVSVNTGSGSGDIQLDVSDNDSIIDAASNPLSGPGIGNGNFAAGERYAIDKTTPTVVSSVRNNPNPTSKTSVDFTVTFSKIVTGVDATDFTLTTTGGVSGASITGFNGSGTTYTVSVNTGSGNGTIRLGVLDDDSIQDAVGNLLAGAFTSGEAYTVNKILTSYSNSSQDGWVLESSETSNAGSLFNSTAATFNLGDDAGKRQYRAILSFNTGALPDDAVITSITLKVKKQGVTGGGNPVTMFQGFMVDIKKGLFGTATLQTSDFQAAAHKTYGPFSPALVGNWYSINLTSGKPYINKLSAASGLTQMRLRFKLDDNNNTIANYLRLYSGNAGLVNRPQLVITYYVP